MATDQGDFPAAQALYEESLAIRRELGDHRGIAGALRNLGSLAQKQGDSSAARAMCEQSLAIHRDLGNRWEIAISLCTLGYVTGDQGDYEAARALHEEALRIHWELDNRWIIAQALEALAGVVSVLAEPFRAPRIWGAAERLREDMAYPLLPADRVRYDREVASARAAAGDDSAFDSAWQEGRTMTLEQAVGYALKGQDR